LTGQTALSIGVSLTQYGGNSCQEDTFISPIWNQYADGACNTFSSSPVGKSLSVDTFNTNGGGGDFTCPDGQYAVLKVWQSSDNCGNIPDASIGALSMTPQEGGCIIMPARSARLECIQS